MIEPDDRRYCVIEVNDDYKENHDFFGQLHDSFAVDGFYENLITFFVNQNIDNWNPEKTLPFTKAKKNIIDTCVGLNYPDIVSFTNADKNALKNSVERQKLYDKYKEWAIQNAEEVQNQRDFVKCFFRKM